MAIIYAKHAEEMLAFRKIKKSFVKKCIENSDIIKPAKEGKKAYLKDFGKNYLKVLVAYIGKDFIIVTAYWIAKKKIKK